MKKNTYIFVLFTTLLVHIGFNNILALGKYQEVILNFLSKKNLNEQNMMVGEGIPAIILGVGGTSYSNSDLGDVENMSDFSKFDPSKN